MRDKLETQKEGIAALQSVDKGAVLPSPPNATLAEVPGPRRTDVRGEGHGGGAGSAHGTARIGLAPEGEGTKLTWMVQAEVGGKLAAIPSFVVNMAAKRVASGFVEKFAARVEKRPVAAKKSLLKKIVGG